MKSFLSDALGFLFAGGTGRVPSVLGPAGRGAHGRLLAVTRGRHHLHQVRLQPKTSHI
jgi:hypothetical protein